MARRPNTNVRGEAFDAATVNAVWNKAKIVAGHDPATTRKDACNAFMKRGDYGKLTTYGWEVDHVKPVARGGGDDLTNLQPLQWENNRHKSDDWPQWSCKVTAAA
jgi:hypothetical protein